MHHAKKIYKSAPKKQLRQMMGEHFIPSLKMKAVREKKSQEAIRVHSAHPLSYEQESLISGGPLSEEEWLLRKSIREAREVHQKSKKS